MQIPKIRIKYRLITRLLFANIFLAAIPIIIAGILLIQRAQKSIEDTIFTRNLEFARKEAQNISLQLSHAREILKFNADNIYNFNLNRVTREVLLNSILTEFNIFNEIYVLDTNGRIQLSTHYFDTDYVFMDRDFRDIVEQGKSYSSEIFISENKLPYMEIAEPIYFLGDIQGILFAKVNLRVIWDILDNLVIGNEGQAFIFDNNGTYIAHSNRIQVYMREKFTESKILNSVNDGNSGHEIYRNQDHENILACFAPVQMTKWGIVIQQPTKEAFAQVRAMRFQILLLVISSIIIASLIAFLYTRRILRPINHLIEGIQRFSTGDLDYKIVTSGEDEIATLIEHVNAMAIKLKDFQISLKRTERFETLSRMAAILSHEIKNPLNAMVINMQILKKELKKEYQNKERLYNYHKIILSEINRVDKLVNNFLLLTRPPKSEKEPVIIQSILDEIIEEQKLKTQKQNVNVTKNFFKKPVEIFTDSSRLKQAFLNIYINAIQAMKNGGDLFVLLTLQRTINKYEDKKAVKIQFKDSGIGIKQTEIDKIFDFYYTTKASGTGLGLAISQQIIEENNGSIKALNNELNGATFIVTLPIIS